MTFDLVRHMMSLLLETYDFAEVYIGYRCYMPDTANIKHILFMKWF